MTGFTASVVIPLHNKQAFIRRTLQSALAQSLAPVEIIIVDDSSTDGSVAAIADLVGGTPLGGIVRLVEQANAGPGPARNRGIAEATGDWIAFLDADDLWQPNHLATLAEVATAFTDTAVIAAHHRRLGATDPVPVPDLSPAVPRKLDFFREAQAGEAVQTSAVAVRRAALIDVGGFGAFYPGEDLDLWTRLALAHDFAASPRTTALYVQDTGGVMQSGSTDRPVAAHQPMFDVLAAALADPGQAPRHRAVRGLRDSLLRNSVKQELHRGDCRAGRALIRDCDSIGTAVPRSYRLLAQLPGPLAVAAIRLAVRLR